MAIHAKLLRYAKSPDFKQLIGSGDMPNIALPYVDCRYALRKYIGTNHTLSTITYIHNGAGRTERVKSVL